MNRTWGLSITTTKKEDMRLEGRQGGGMGGGWRKVVVDEYIKNILYEMHDIFKE